VKKYSFDPLHPDAPGVPQWTQTLGQTGANWGYAIATNALGDVYVAGRTNGSLSTLGDSAKGGWDAFLSRFDENGNLKWTRQFGTDRDEWGLGVSTDALGNAYLTGFTYGALGGANLGDQDAFVVNVDRDGHLLWLSQFGTAAGDGAFGISVDDLASAYLTGITAGSLPGWLNLGASDAFLVKLSPVPAPGAALLAGVGLGLAGWLQRRRAS
jgi:hypothetical protein